MEWWNNYKQKFKEGECVNFRGENRKIKSIDIYKNKKKYESDYNFEDGSFTDIETVEDGFHRVHTKRNHTGETPVYVDIEPAVKIDCPHNLKGGKSKISRNVKRKKSSKFSKKLSKKIKLRRNKKTRNNMKKIKGVDIKYNNTIKNKFKSNKQLHIIMIKNINIVNINVEYIINENDDQYIEKSKRDIMLKINAPFIITTGDQINYQIRLENNDNLNKYTNIPNNDDISLPQNCIAIELIFTLDELKKYIFPNSDLDTKIEEANY